MLAEGSLRAGPRWPRERVACSRALRGWGAQLSRAKGTGGAGARPAPGYREGRVAGQGQAAGSDGMSLAAVTGAGAGGEWRPGTVTQAGEAAGFGREGAADALLGSRILDVS